MAEEELKMSFDPQTIEHLGIKMYSRLPNALAELIANAYDADASKVYIKITEEEKSISISDNGVGMSFDEINDKFLRIGRKRRNEDNEFSPSGKRKISGRKGLGKLAFFGIGNIIEIITKKAKKCTNFTMSWNDIISSTEKEYKPVFSVTDCLDETGTTIIIKELKRETLIDKNDLAVSLSKLFNYFDDSFQVFISLNDDKFLKIDNKLRYKYLNSQIEWIIPGEEIVENNYFSQHKVNGIILATEKPLKPELRGITLFAHGRLVNIPEFFGVGESSHGYSYFTGWINVDFVDEEDEDYISTDRQALNWDLPLTDELRKKLQALMHYIERDWRTRRKTERTNKISNQTKIDINSWCTKLPVPVKSGVEKILNSVIDDSELDSDKQKEIVIDLHKLLPEYTYYHYRHLHNAVKKVSEQDYKNQDYYRAFEETMKHYIIEVQKKSGLTNSDVSLMQNAFGKDKQRLKVAKKFRRKNNDEFNASTLANIEEGQRWLSVGVMEGARNPIAHEEISDLRDSGLFSEMDCLDSLSLLSHLFRRLDNAE